MALAICSMPRACSSLPRCTSSTRVFTLTALSVMERMASATLSNLPMPSWDLAMDSSISDAVSLAACAQRCARLRTSSATTAKPMPASPARAASTAACRRLAYLCAHSRKAHACPARAGRLDRRVQGQNVGLESDLVDDFDDFGDLFAGCVDFGHGCHHLFECLVGGCHPLIDLAGEFGGHFGVLGIFLGHGVDLLAGGRSLF